MRGRNQFVDGIVHERRIAEISVAIGERATLGFGEVVHRVDRTVTPLGERIRLDDLRDLAQRRAAGTRRAGGKNRVAVVVALDRRVPLHAVVGEILQREDAAVGPAGLDHGVRDRTLVERVGAALGDLFQRVRQLRLHQALTGDERFALMEKNGCDVRVLGEVVDAVVENVHIALLEHVALARELDRGRDHLLQRQRAVFFERLVQSHHCAGHADAEIRIGAAIRDDVAVGVLEHRRRRFRRCLLAKIEE